MRNGAVVALEVVLDADLPVRVVLALGPPVEDERVDVDATFGDESRQVAQVLRKRTARRVGIDEDERPPGVDRDGHEPEAAAVEAGLGVGSGCGPQRSVEVVRPGVVGTLQRLALPGAVAEEVAAMTADVDECAERVVAAAHEDDRHVARAGRHERTGLAQVAGVAGVLPGAPEDPLLLEPRDRRVDVPVPGDRAAAGDGCHRRDASRFARRLRAARGSRRDDDPGTRTPGFARKTRKPVLPLPARAAGTCPSQGRSARRQARRDSDDAFRDCGTTAGTLARMPGSELTAAVDTGEIAAAVVAESAYMEDVLCRLIEAPTVLGNEEAGQEVMRDAFREIGLEPVDMPLDVAMLRAHPAASPFSWDISGKRNVVADWPPAGEGGRSLVLNGHIDVVAAASTSGARRRSRPCATATGSTGAAPAT